MTKLSHGRGMSSLAAYPGGSLPPLKDLIAGIDLPALVAAHTGPGKHSGGSWVFPCPNPAHPDTHASFSVFKGRGGVWLCHCLSQCDHIGDALEFLKWHYQCDTAEGVSRLRQFAGLPQVGTHREKSGKRGEKHAPQFATSDETSAGGIYTAPEKSKTKPVAAPQDPGYTVLNEPDTLNAYLNARQWPLEVVETFGLKVVRLNRNTEARTVRVLHPFTEWREGAWRETAWQARRIDNSSERRWLGPLNAPLPLYNLRGLDPAELRAVVVCEGVSDTVTAWLAVRDLEGVGVVGVPGAQAWRREWAAYFTGLEVVIAGDNDKAGALFTAKVAAELRGVASSLIDACPAQEVNDLTDMAKAYGIDGVRGLLLGALKVSAPPQALPTTPPLDPVALVLEQFAGSFTVCRVCTTPTEHTYCTNCDALARVGRSKPVRWSHCDTCGEHSLGGNGRKCKRLECGGTFAVSEVRP
jgi:hypothetical protein